MKVQLNHLASSFIVFILSTLLIACGGSSSSNDIRYSVSVDQSNIEFINEAATTSEQTISVNVTYSGKGLLVGVPNDGTVPAWLTYQVTELTSTSAVIEFTLANEDLIAPDNYTTQVRVTSGDIDASEFVHSDITIDFNVWQLTIDDNPISLEATKGDTTTADFDIRLIAGNTNWQITSDLSWLSFEISEGEGTGELETVVATADYSAIAEAGNIEGSIILSDTTTSTEKAIPVSLALDEVYVYSNQSSVSFIKTANTEHLTRTIDVSSNAENAIAWQADTSANWLTLVPSSDGKSLTISADASLVSAPSMQTAQINLTSTGDVSAQPSIVKVSFSHSEDTLPASEVISDISVNNDGLAINPVMPKLYAAVNNTIRVYHQYTLALEQTIEVATAGLSVENVVITKDAKYLFALTSETTTDSEGVETTSTSHYRIDLSTNISTELVDADISGAPIEHFVIDGRQFIITDQLEVADTDLMQAYAFEGGIIADQLTFADGSNALYVTTGGPDIFRFTVKVNEFAENNVILTFDQQYAPENGGNAGIFDIIVNNQDDLFYLLNANTDWLSFDGETFTDNGKLIIDDTITALGLVSNQSKTPYYLRVDNTPRVYVESFNNTQTKVSDTTVLTLLPDIIAIDNSGTRFISYAESVSSIVLYPITLL